MQTSLFLFLSLLQGWATGPGKGPIRHAGLKTYQLFYVDNSHTRGYESFSPDLLDMLTKKIDSIHENRVDDIALFSSNGPNPDFVGNYKGAKSVVDKLSNGYTAEPYSPFDKSAVIDRVASSDLSGIKKLNVYFFVTEAYLVNDLLKTNTGLLFNILPEELRFLVGCGDEQVNVYVYFPASSTTVKDAAIAAESKLVNAPGGLHSNIHYHVQGI
jgi:hypothetical protein